MINLTTRDLIVLHEIAEWNKKEAQRLKAFPENARPSMAKPCTITVLCGHKQAGGGLVNQFIDAHKMVIEKADDSEQVYRSLTKLVNANLVIETVASRGKSFSQSRLGEKLISTLSANPIYWPTQVEIDGNNIKVTPTLSVK